MRSPTYSPRATPAFDWRPRLSVVLPTYNESGNIERLVQAVREAAQAGSELEIVVVDDAFLAAQGIESELPLWGGVDPDWAAWADVDVSHALAAGLSFRPIEDTVAATLAHTELVPGIGLTAEREAELLASWRASSPG